MPTPRELAILKAQKLAAVAADQPDAPEGRTAADLLARLRGKWSIKDTELATVQVRRFPVDRATEAEWRLFLVAICAEFFGCSSTHGRRHSMLFGVEAEVENAQGLFTRLAEAVEESMEEHWFLSEGREHDWGMTMVIVFHARMQNLQAQEQYQAQEQGKDQEQETGLVTKRAGEESVRQAKAAAEGETKPNSWRPIQAAIQAANSVSLREPAAPPPVPQPADAASTPG